MCTGVVSHHPIMLPWLPRFPSPWECSHRPLNTDSLLTQTRDKLSEFSLPFRSLYLNSTHADDVRHHPIVLWWFPTGPPSRMSVLPPERRTDTKLGPDTLSELSLTSWSYFFQLNVFGCHAAAMGEKRKPGWVTKLWAWRLVALIISQLLVWSIPGEDSSQEGP
jgi:hypothetical protein